MRRLLQQFLQLESSSGILLIAMAVVSVIWANSPLAFLQQQFVDVFLFWINEGLMAIFFLLVGLELKRGTLEGYLSKRSQVLLPAFAALGGMIIPALLYFLINHANATTLKGWATPVATDIAFALGVLSLFGSRVSTSLKLFLLALAIFDDMGAIIIIALFYSHSLSYLLLFQALLLVLILYAFNLIKIRSLIPYLLIGVLLWITLLFSGIHPTIAGVLLAFMIPDHSPLKGRSLLHTLEQVLHPWVAYLIIPIFVLANAGFSLRGFSFKILTDPVVFGIIAGLFIGKQVGVFGFSWVLIRMGFAKLPEQCSFLAFYGVSLLCGIGFTMSLFLGTLSFQHETHYLLANVRFGVIIGSVLSGLLGSFVLLTAFSKMHHSKEAHL